MLTIREMRSEDYDALVVVWKEAGLPFRPDGRDQRERITQEISGQCSIFLVAEIKRRIVGAVLGTHDGRKGWINRLAVLPHHRRQWIAAALVAAVEAQLAKLGIEIVACLVEDWNKDSMIVFERLGYERHPDVLYFSKRKNAGV